MLWPSKLRGGEVVRHKGEKAIVISANREFRKRIRVPKDKIPIIYIKTGSIVFVYADDLELIEKSLKMAI